jgi:hypothetical protein
MTQQAQQVESGGVLGYTLAFVGVILLVILVIVAGFQASIAPFWIWLILLALFVAATLILSRTFTRRWLGVLIDERNKYSLSRFQMIFWTVIILSAFMASVLANVQLNLLVYVSVGSEPPLIFYEQSGNLVVDALFDAGVIFEDESGSALTTLPGVDISQLDLQEPLKDGQQIYVTLAGETAPVRIVDPRAQDAPSASATTPLSVQIPNEVWLLLGAAVAPASIFGDRASSRDHKVKSWRRPGPTRRPCSSPRSAANVRKTCAASGRSFVTVVSTPTRIF